MLRCDDTRVRKKFKFLDCFQRLCLDRKMAFAYGMDSAKRPVGHGFLNIGHYARKDILSRVYNKAFGRVSNINPRKKNGEGLRIDNSIEWSDSS